MIFFGYFYGGSIKFVFAKNGKWFVILHFWRCFWHLLIIGYPNTIKGLIVRIIKVKRTWTLGTVTLQHKILFFAYPVWSVIHWITKFLMFNLLVRSDFQVKMFKQSEIVLLSSWSTLKSFFNELVYDHI